MERRALVRRKWRFIDLPVKQRNRIIDSFLEVKSRLKRGFSLKELGLNGMWDNITFKEFLIHPEQHYVKIVRNSPKKNISKSKLIRSIRSFYKVAEGHINPKASKLESLEEWFLKPSTS